MKKIILTMMVAFAALSANAQETKNFIGGSVGYVFNSNDGVKGHIVTLAPEYGRKLNEKWTLGLNFDYDCEKIKDGETEHFVGINPYARYTFKEFGRVALFCDGGVGFGVNKAKHEDATTGFEVGFKPGIEVELAKNLAFEAHIGFLGFRKDYIQPGKTFGAYLDGGLNFGLFYHF